MSLRRRLACALVLLVLAWGSLEAQAPAQTPAQAPAPAQGAGQGQAPAQTPGPAPEPYAPGEFPVWLSDLWRGEAIFVGAFPLSLFVTLEVYDSVRYFSNAFAPQYAPWPFGSGKAAPYNQAETAWLGVSAVSLSLVVAGIDFLLGRLDDGSRVVEIRVEDPADNGKRADIFLAERLGLFTRSQARRRVTHLRVNGTAARLSRRLRAGDLVALSFVDPPPSVLAAQEITLDVLFENQDVVVVNKPQGMVVHPGSGNHDGTLVNALLFLAAGLADRFGPGDPRPGIVHRLDKDTSGVIIVAKNPAAHEFLSAQFRDRTVRKRYIAVVRGCLASMEGRLETRLARDPRNRQRFTCVSAGGRLAVTRYRVLARMTTQGARETGGKPTHELVLCAPRTGRTHQLRVHMRHAGAPILGDPIYGGADPSFPDVTLMLHARSLSVRLPGQDAMTTFTAPVPPRFREVLGKLQSFSPSHGL